MKMKNNDIKQTTNYSQFKIGDWNRAVKANNLKKIDKSVHMYGWLKHPIMVSPDFTVIDGQHRLEYAKQHNLPVYYIVVPGVSVQDCVTMNNVRTTWNLVDYVNLFASQGNPNYVILKSLIQNYSFLPPSTLVAVLSKSSSNGNLCTTIKTGEYEITAKDHDGAIDKLEMLKRCSRYILSVPGRASALFTAVAYAYDLEGIDKERLEKQLKTNINIITPPANLEMALKEVEYLYNYRNNRSSYVYILNEYKRDLVARMSRKKKKEEHNG